MKEHSSVSKGEMKSVSPSDRGRAVRAHVRSVLKKLAERLDKEKIKQGP
jgi:hypothetical protein